MSLAVFAAVLAAALMHAGWNALIKVGLDRFSSVLLLVLAQTILSLILLPFFPLPLAAAIPWLAASGIVHTPGGQCSVRRAHRNPFPKGEGWPEPYGRGLLHRLRDRADAALEYRMRRVPASRFTH